MRQLFYKSYFKERMNTVLKITYLDILFDKRNSKIMFRVWQNIYGEDWKHKFENLKILLYDREYVALS